MSAYTVTFRDWLAGQAGRGDAVGTFARAVHADPSLYDEEPFTPLALVHALRVRGCAHATIVLALAAGREYYTGRMRGVDR